MVIYKFELEMVDEQEVQVPFGAVILTAEVQKGKICLWAIVEPNNPPVTFVIHIYGTGNPLPELNNSNRVHVNTILIPPFVWHVFQIIGPKGDPVAESVSL